MLGRKYKQDAQGYMEFDCKKWKHVFQPGIDIYDKKQGAVWCCSECHYGKHMQTSVRKAPIKFGPYKKVIVIGLYVCCAVGAKCRKNLSNQAKFQN